MTEFNKPDLERFEQNSKNTTKNIFAPKTPSKVLGPLAIYQNEDVNSMTSSDILGNTNKPKLTPEENPYYHQQNIPYPKPDTKPKPIKDKTTNYISSSKPEKVVNKKVPLFVTPPPLDPSESNNRIPNSPGGKMSIPQNAVKSEIEIHGNGNPEELLQFINQHPEISNYPTGSVLEIHKVPIAANQKPTNFPPNTKSQIHLVPYLVPTNAAGEPNHNDLPPGFSLDQILKEFHKNSQPQSNIPMISRPPFVGSNGPVIVPQQTGSVLFGNQNNTHKG